ncbi:MAG: CotH kinase family protein [Bacteroidales bacterium]|nr:CotH kinase family protein [Bacteroidales bacterium]
MKTNQLIRKQFFFAKKWLIVAMLIFSASVGGQVLIPYQSSWKFFKGTTAVSNSWILSTYNDVSWSVGLAPFWYGAGTGGTQLADMQNNYTTVFLRKQFEVTTPDSLMGYLVGTFKYDDGFRIWINGNLAFERNAPQTNNYNDVAPTSVNMVSTPITDSVSSGKVDLVQGKNTICVLLFNVNLGSSDVYFDMQLSLSKKIPKTPDVVFSHQGGYYNAPFMLTLTGQKPGDTILYTLDYSDPRTSSTAISGLSPLKINIDPDNTTKRPATPAVVVRAVMVKRGFQSANPETRTYIFLEKVKTQGIPGGSWPEENLSDNNRQYIDYKMDARVINDNRYKNLIPQVFSSIPTVSVVTENPNLFDPTIGIYVNAMQHGEAWERPASVELIDTDNTMAFSVNAGLRIRGGWSRNNWNPKHAFRLFFSNDYGKKKLKYPLFGTTDAAQEFKKVDLRCAQNYSWSFYNNPMMTYAQDETCRDLQGLMGHPYSRSRYCHLFLNGMYWGLYEFQERPEANFAESYKGGDKGDYDVVKVATDNGYNIEATDGTLDKWRLVYNACNTGFKSDANYFRLQGLNAQGYIDTSLEKLVDIDNLIDYMINIFYTGNFDAPVSEFMGNNQPNNFYAIKNRNARREGFFFIVHDAEHTFNYVAGSEEGKNEGVNENRVNLANDGMTKPPFNFFHPQWLHHRLTENANYRLRFADRAVKYLYNNGLLTPTEVEKVFRARASQIDLAIIGESARWGDTNFGTLRTRDDSWIPAVNNTVNLFIKKRTPIVINQLKTAGLLPTVEFPKIYADGTEVNTNLVNLSKKITVTFGNPNSSGVLYYTLDGKDPRNSDNMVSASAQTATTFTTISISSPVIIKARVFQNDNWSAIREVVFTNKANRDKIKITEIQYMPMATAGFGDKSLEYIELKNTSDVWVDIGGCRLDSAIKYVFPAPTLVPPHGFAVVAADISAFESLYWTTPTGRFSGNLANEGERIVLLDDNGQLLTDVSYKPNLGWPTLLPGYSLVPNDPNPTGNPNDPTYWRSSVYLFGSPFADDDSSYVKPNAVNFNVIFCDVFPNPASDYLNIKVRGLKLDQMAIYNMQGKPIFIRSLKGKIYDQLKLNTSQWPRGVYILLIRAGSDNYRCKVIIQN